jgi:tetratricopeptide (TPR) repeat protein
LSTLGRIQTDRGNLEAATQNLERGLALHRRVFGDADPRTFDAKAGYAWVLVTRDRSAQAEPLLREIVEDARRTYGPTHPDVGVALSNLANAVSDLPGRFSDAENVYLEAISVLRRSREAAAPELATALNNLCSLYLKMKRWAVARDNCAEATTLRLGALGPDHPETSGSRLGEALALIRLGEYQRAEQLLRGVIQSFTRTLGADHWRTANAEIYLGTALTQMRRYKEASTMLAHSEQALLATLGPEHARTKAAQAARAELRLRRSGG